MSINEYSEGAVASLSTIANYIAPVTTPLIIEPQELSPQARLDMYISVAARASDLHVMETALGMTLRTIRAIQNAAISSTMPTAAKLKACETPILNIVLEFAGKSPEWRALVVQMMIENISTGSGHLSINRAKQVLKEIAKRAPFNNLVSELNMSSHARRMAAIYLLGWLKHEKAIEPLVEAFEVTNAKQQEAILEMLEEHYSHKLPFYLKWRCVNRQSPTPALTKLMQLLQFEA
ncbi:hypothetical protein KBI23_00095 [bacterium]|nr:hypothetical protein [bacterium]MBP9809164.1 hypothetical protein [bacterium]